MKLRVSWSQPRLLFVRLKSNHRDTARHSRNQKDAIQRETGRVGAARCGDRLRGRFFYSPLFPRPSRGLVCPTRLRASLVAPTWRDSETFIVSLSIARDRIDLILGRDRAHGWQRIAFESIRTSRIADALRSQEAQEWPPARRAKARRTT